MFLLQPAKGNHYWYSYALTLIFVILGYILFQLPMTAVILAKIAGDDDLDISMLSDFEKNPDFSMFGIDKNLGLALMIITFLGIWVGLYLGVKFLHRRPFNTLIASGNKIRWKRIFWGFGLWMILASIYTAGEWLLYPDRIVIQWEWSRWLPLLLVALFILPIQTTAEELLFRGYLLQSISYISRRPWVGILLSSVLFGAIHGMNPEIKHYGVVPMQLYYIGAGLFLALLTVMDDGLELAIGVHAATNIYGAVISSYEKGVIQTDSIFVSTDLNPWAANFGFFVAAILFLWMAKQTLKWKTFREQTYLENENENDE